MTGFKTALLIIDAQYDFCNPYGTLFVPGADKDVLRIAQMIAIMGEKIDQIFVTLDTHHVLDIAHPLFWEDPNGNTVAPFTLITASAVREGKWIPRFHKDAVIAYLKTLENDGQFKHFIWPEHCLLGSKGAALDDAILHAVLAWTHLTRTDYKSIIKGLNSLTEHFGVFKAQVPNAKDPDTKLNQDLLDELESYDRVLIVGEARSHCIATSVKQILDYAPALIPKVTLLTDCVSDVTNWSHLADPIFEDAEKRGMIFCTSMELRI